MIIKSYRKGDVELMVTRNDDERLTDENRYIAIRIIRGEEPDFQAYQDIETASDQFETWIDALEGDRL